MLTLDKIYHAAFVLKDVARKTDLIEAPRLSKDCQLYLKTENLQVTGSFKVRGAYYKISQLSKEESDKGVIACSAGNHAQGVALAATRRGIKSIVCMPDGAPIMKVENTKNLGAEVCLVPGTYDDAHDKAVELQAETGMTFIHPYDDEQVIAGQGTIGLEILDQLPDVDAVIVPVGGGGLISGVAFAIKSLKPDVKVYGVQAEGAPSMYRSLHEHKYQTLSAVSTFADGIQVKTPGELTYKICEEYVDDIVTVTEDETAAAILSLMENQKLVAEGAGAVPVAAALFHKLPIEGKKVVCLVSGGNIDVNILNRVITRGLVMSGRKANLTIALEDKPGQLEKVAAIVSRCGSNVVSVLHDGSDPNMPISSCFLKLALETRDNAQIEQIRPNGRRFVLSAYDLVLEVFAFDLAAYLDLRRQQGQRHGVQLVAFNVGAAEVDVIAVKAHDFIIPRTHTVSSPDSFLCVLFFLLPPVVVRPEDADGGEYHHREDDAGDGLIVGEKVEQQLPAAHDELQHTQKPLPEAAGLFAGRFQPLAQYAGQLEAEDVCNAPDEEDDADDKMVYHKLRSFLRYALNRKTFTVQVYHIGETPARTGFACPAQKIWVEPPGGACGMFEKYAILFSTDAPSPSGKAGDFDSPIVGSTPAGATAQKDLHES